MRTNSRRKSRLVSQINVVPYIDVMLVLLVIFMVTAPMMNPSQVELPQVGKSTAPPVAPVEVILKKDLSLLLRDHAEAGKEMHLSREELIEQLKLKQAKHEEQSVVISADKSVRYEEVIKIMDLLQQQNIKKIGLLTQSKDK